MHIFFKKILYSFIVLTLFLYGSEVDKLLETYSQKNDLSQKTIDENKGHLVLFSRDKLERMHAKTLKDVLKTTPILYYRENRYGFPDPLASGSFESYRSNFIRLYIDGVEITQGWLGSGLVLYGDVNIDFVDHIEFYYMTPSFETITESAYLTIFLYSKEPPKEGGGEVNLIQGSRGYASQTLNYGEKNEDYSYMLNFSHTDAQRQKVANGTDTPLLRDFERTQLFSYIKTQKQTAHLQIMKKNMKSLAGPSLDATPLISTMNYLNIHLDYSLALSEHWDVTFSYDWVKGEYHFEDDLPFVSLGNIPSTLLKFEGKNSTYTGELSYQNVFEKHRIDAGLKIRSKVLDAYDVVNLAELPFNFSKETFFSLYGQDQYHLGENTLLTFGIQYNHIDRDGNQEMDDLLQLRLGYIFSNEVWSYKAYIFRSMFTTDSNTRYLLSYESRERKPQVSIGITQEVAYKSEDFNLRLMLLTMQDENGLIQNEGKGHTKYFFTIFNYNYNFDLDNKMDLQFSYAHYKDIFYLDTLDDYSGYVSFSNQYKDVDFYNSVVWHQDSLTYEHFFDWTSSISWNVNHNLSFTLKGENILDKARDSGLIRIDPRSGNFLTPLSMSSIDQRIMLEMEYRF